MSGVNRFVKYTHQLADRIAEWGWTAENAADLLQLADAVARGSVVAYVGAGPSIASHLPGWSDACNELYRWTLEQRTWSKEEQEFLKSLIEKEDFPLFVQILENQYQDNQDVLYRKLRDMFRTAGIEPSDAHIAIATLPIPLRITTNYEELLDQAISELPKAYASHSFDGLPLTWLDGSRLLELVRSRAPGLIKVHGDFSKQESVVLTSNHYRRLSYDTAFWSVLKALISTHSFLFIGCSLRDPDLFSLLDEVIEECRVLNDRRGVAKQPMHYSLLPRSAANPAFVSHLRANYGIAVLPVPEEVSKSPEAGERPQPKLTAVLRLLSGEVARRMRTADYRGIGDRPRIYTGKAHLAEIVRLTGSHRGDVVLADDDKTHQLKWWLNWDKDTSVENARFHDEPPQPTGVISSTFAERVDFLYVPDTRATVESGVPYMEHDPRVRSELAIPILARGYRIGVLNVESYLPDAYCAGHIAFLQQQAALIGSEHIDAQERNQRIDRVLTANTRSRFIEHLHGLYAGAKEFVGVLYTANYVTNKLTGAHLNPHVRKPVTHRLDSTSSFAARVFREAKARHLYEVERSPGEFDSENAALVGLKSGPLFGTQVFDRGLPCAVLVLWAKQDSDPGSVERCGLRDPSKRLLLATTANLIVAGGLLTELHRGSNTASAQDSPSRLNQVFGAIHDIEGQSELGVYERVAGAVRALGLRRLRIWQVLPGEEFAEIVFASPDEHAAVVGQKETWITGSVSPAYSPYSALIKGRYPTDPWARAQGPSMFNLGPDPLAKELQKPQDACWIVAPLVAHTVAPNDTSCFDESSELIGYLAVDNVPEDLDLANELVS